jgi:hypothetical protein
MTFARRIFFIACIVGGCASDADTDFEAEEPLFPELADRAPPIGRRVDPYEPYGAIGDYYRSNGGADVFGKPLTAELEVGADAPCSRLDGSRGTRWQRFTNQYALCWNADVGVWSSYPFPYNPQPGGPREIPPGMGIGSSGDIVAEPAPKWFWWNVGCYCSGYDSITPQYWTNSIAAAHVCVDESSEYVDPTTDGEFYCQQICNTHVGRGQVTHSSACGVFIKTESPCTPQARPEQHYLGSAPTCAVR